jgi:hypothetical protein
MNKSEEKKLDKIIEQNAYIIGLLEAVVDDAHLVSQLQEALKKNKRLLREIEYEQWFKGHEKG